MFPLNHYQLQQQQLQQQQLQQHMQLQQQHQQYNHTNNNNGMNNYNSIPLNHSYSYYNPQHVNQQQLYKTDSFGSTISNPTSGQQQMNPYYPTQNIYTGNQYLQQPNNNNNNPMMNHMYQQNYQHHHHHPGTINSQYMYGNTIGQTAYIKPLYQVPKQEQFKSHKNKTFIRKTSSNKLKRENDEESNNEENYNNKKKKIIDENKKIPFGDSLEEINKWIEERKKKFPRSSISLKTETRDSPPVDGLIPIQTKDISKNSILNENTIHEKIHIPLGVEEISTEYLVENEKLPQGDENSKKKLKICQFFLKGKPCPQGSKCLYSHDESEREVYVGALRLRNAMKMAKSNYGIQETNGNKTLLRKLLETEIKREHEIFLQCVPHLLKLVVKYKSNETEKLNQTTIPVTDIKPNDI